jgi:tRNA pseudouridine55 synthase
MEGNITKTASYDHIAQKMLIDTLPKFVGSNIQQIPPLYSAIKRNGKALYKEARAGKTTDDIIIPPRIVEIHKLDLLNFTAPEFEIHVECGGGTYIRSLIRDIGYELNTVATTTVLQRTKQGPFSLQDVLSKEDWTASNIYAAINKFNNINK